MHFGFEKFIKKKCLFYREMGLLRLLTCTGTCTSYNDACAYAINKCILSMS